mgnify:CR=1 FL=1
MTVRVGIVWFCLAALLLAVTGCADEKSSSPSPSSPPTPEQVRAIAKSAYTYGFPMVDNYRVQYSYFADKAGPEYKVLAVNDLGDRNHASPAVCGSRLFLVGMNQVYCVGR